MFVTADGRWRVESIRHGTAYDLCERLPDGHVQTRLHDVSLAEVAQYLAEQGVDAKQLRRA